MKARSSECCESSREGDLVVCYPTSWDPSGWRYLELTPRLGELSAGRDKRVPASVERGMVRRYQLPGPDLDRQQIMALMDRIGDLAVRVLDGWEGVRDGGHYFGRLNEDATAAEQDLLEIVATPRYPSAP